MKQDMGSSQLSFFLFIFFCYNVTITTANQICPISACSDTEPAILFPFRIKDLQPETCRYPGFDLTCNNMNLTILNITSSGGFWLQSINYFSQELYITDPDGCLPKRLLSFNLTGSPFRSESSQTFTFMGCLNQQVLSHPSYKPIGCMSNSTYDVLATPSGTTVKTMSSIGCHVIGTVDVPTSWQGFYSQNSFSELNADLKLTWDVPQCGNCEHNVGSCGFKNDSSLEVQCVDVPRQGPSKGIRNYAVSIGVGVPVLLYGIGIAWFLCRRAKRIRNRNSRALDASTINPQPTVVMVGLDDPTIESYPKTPSDNTCTICLSEYQPKETLRTIPECQHCFHVDCIDEWLRINATCPLCRTSPTGAHSP
ncbi:hypothetical protein NE237_030794 [Protea cynaroides]|uniref:RING-type E3 ubiquitin transferase n=1 Tax=Protea cynaroides TaxID=273540 RepID=A0A9Q0GTP0_9MAGN|nr:hypothetical protein NE237_030794 [Protea cynaroides]